VDFRQLVDLALAGDAAAAASLKETAHYLGVGIANLTQGLAPEAVIVGGPVVRAWPLIVEDIKAAVAEGICRGLPPVHILASSLGEQPTLMGALSLVLTTKFTHVALA
jgi:predicted NBD/HSP70 family sugar kinase